jgi:hypothetical protein
LTLFPLPQFRKRKSAVKLHTLLEVRGSIPINVYVLREYALKNGIKMLREFVDVETAKTAGRKQFGQMVLFFQQNAQCYWPGAKGWLLPGQSPLQSTGSLFCY